MANTRTHIISQHDDAVLIGLFLSFYCYLFNLSLLKWVKREYVIYSKKLILILKFNTYTLDWLRGMLLVIWNDLDIRRITKNLLIYGYY